MTKMDEDMRNLRLLLILVGIYGASGQCTNGLYGTACDKTCAQISGIEYCVKCTESNPGIYTCAECQSGYYSKGSNCDICSQGCLPVSGNSSCLPTNGDCRIGCTTGYVDVKCNRCDNNYYFTGGVCYKCSDECVNSCDGFTGFCNGGCRPGYFGRRCENTCSISCKGSLCDSTTGECSTDGCIDRYYGNECQQICGSCACDRTTGQCLGDQCLVGYYGNACDQSCSSFCTFNTCDKSSGNCTYACPNGYYGPFCSRNCSTTCTGNSCQRDDGRCSTSCKDGYHGDFCTSVCSVNCGRGTCSKSDGVCDGECRDGYYGDLCDKICSSACQGPCDRNSGYCSGAQSQDKSNGNSNLALIIGVSCGGGIILLVIIIGVACCQRRQTRHQSKKAMIIGMDGWTFDDERMMDPNAMQYEKTSALNYSVNGSMHQAYPGDTRQSEINYAFDDRDDRESIRMRGSVQGYDKVEEAKGAVSLAEFPKYVARMIATDRAFDKEFLKLPAGLNAQHNDALKPENVNKNRYKNIYAYDHSRIVLESEESEISTSDYINASRIEGYDNEKSYISSQGPTEHTINDFWRMVWQEACRNIVMLTNIVEGGVLKCKKYWPEEKQEETFGSIRVKNNYKEEYADFTITNLTVINGSGTLDVRHLQFTSWPDKEVPKYVTPLVEFNQKARDYMDQTPILVHCSAGIGRSGTFIALDRLLDQAKSDQQINILQCVISMRKDRVNMIQTPAQYRFLHEALLEALQTTDITVRKDEFHEYFKSMMDYDIGSTERRLDTQFKKIKSSSDQFTTEVALLPENSHKNRSNDIVAADECRVFLWSTLHGCNDYINAIHLPNYHNRYAYIITEMPQARTLIDFCRLIHQEECRTIIMMDPTNETSNENYGEYWSEANQSVGCGPFQLHVTAKQTYQNFTCRSIDFKYNVGNVKHDDSLNLIDDHGTVSIKQYQVTCWSHDTPAPSSADGFLELIKSVNNWQEDSGSHPILVHCMNGAYRSGLMCLILACSSRIRIDGDICVPHTLNHMRARRPQLVPYFPQYKFCHEVIQRFIEDGV